jgi:hypothetical protein
MAHLLYFTFPKPVKLFVLILIITPLANGMEINDIEKAIQQKDTTLFGYYLFKYSSLREQKYIIFTKKQVKLITEAQDCLTGIIMVNGSEVSGMGKIYSSWQPLDAILKQNNKHDLVVKNYIVHEAIKQEKWLLLIDLIPVLQNSVNIPNENGEYLLHLLLEQHIKLHNTKELYYNLLELHINTLLRQGADPSIESVVGFNEEENKIIIKNALEIVRSDIFDELPDIRKKILNLKK